MDSFRKNGENMRSIYDVQQLLKKYGTFIYTGDRTGDLKMMDIEINELYKWQFITADEYTQATLCIRKELSQIGKQRGSDANE